MCLFYFIFYLFRCVVSLCSPRGLELAILLPLIPQCWNFRLVFLGLMAQALHTPLCLPPAEPQGLPFLSHRCYPLESPH